jgi:hypothetical protein
VSVREKRGRVSERRGGKRIYNYLEVTDNIQSVFNFLTLNLSIILFATYIKVMRDIIEAITKR